MLRSTTNFHRRQRTSRMSTATPYYKQEVVDFLICMVTQIWFHCTCLQVLILRGSPMNSRGFTHRTSWGITLFTTTFHQRCWEFLECDPFLKIGNELIAIDTRAVMSLGQIQEVDEALHESYVQARILQASVPISNTIPMAAVVHMVRPTRAATFSDYIPMHLVPHPKSLLGPNVQQLDAVWDTYPEWNLKMQAHLRRGNGPRM